MHEPSPEQVVDAWLAAEAAEAESAAYRENRWAVERVLDWALAGQPDPLWEFVRAASRRELTPKAAAALAAGPIEDLLAKFGPGSIGRVESLAREEARFRALLAAVRRFGISDAVWARVQALRGDAGGDPSPAT